MLWKVLNKINDILSNVVNQFDLKYSSKVENIKEKDEIAIMGWNNL